MRIFSFFKHFMSKVSKCLLSILLSPKSSILKVEVGIFSDKKRFLQTAKLGIFFYSQLSGFLQDIQRKSVGFSVTLFYVFLHYFCAKFFTFYILRHFFSFFLSYCSGKLCYVFYFTFTFRIYLVILRFCKIKIRQRKIVVISFYEIFFVHLYFMFTFTFSDLFYFFFISNFTFFLTKKTFYGIKT